MPVNNGRNICLADNPDDFARSVVELSKMHAKRMEMGRQARALVAERFGWPAIADEISRLLGRIHHKQGATETNGTPLPLVSRFSQQRMGT